ncbi:hypothetical protein [Pseudomonas anguilliseptica]|uniref:Uncharacterized protein n=1 Tax=Pseudomonas anguilliseptica TaxID=53406 RepID=A0A1H4S933_PSEAG|nr:hypothetical protein [Pseudomonas anguilliseptica]SEC40580.1 hypothetical protein SAMN05421553_0802 [Pseudomonas anguilliseptica]
MNIMVQPVKTAAGPGWQVNFGKQSVTFRSEREARQFVSTLQARLNAPHRLPFEQQRAAS